MVAGSFCGANTCGDADCATQNVYGTPGLDLFGSMLNAMGVTTVNTPGGPAPLSAVFPLTPDTYYFNQMTGDPIPGQPCSTHSLIYDLSPMGMPPGVGIHAIDQCADLMHAGFDSMMGMPHS